MTHRENEKLGRRFAELDRESVQGLPLSFERLSLSPSDRDFRRVLDKLEKVTNGRGGLGRVTLKPGRPCETTLDEGVRESFRVFTRGQPCPLRIILRRTGRTVLCVSRVEMEPTEEICDVMTKAEKLTLNDASLKFKCDNVFVSVFAQEEAKVVLTVYFGRETKEVLKQSNHHRRKVPLKDEAFRALDELKRDESKMNAFYDHVEHIERIRREQVKQRCKEKDFIELNKALSPPSTDRSEHMQQLKQRISLAHEMRSRHLHDKKKRALAMLFRKEQLQELALQARVSAEAKERLQTAQKSVLTTVALVVSLESMQELLCLGKRRAQEAKRRVMAAQLIQRALRRSLRKLNRTGLAVNLFRSSVFFLRSHYAPLLRVTMARHVKDCIAVSCKNQVLPQKLRNFYRKVALIRTRWREYADLEKKRWARLLGVWGEVLERLQTDFSRKKTAAKKPRTKRRTEDSSSYYAITPAAKQAVLSRHLLECKRKLRCQIKDYLAATHLLRQVGYKSFLTLAQENPALLSSAPQLQYLPAPEEMARLIDSALIPQ